MNPSDISALAVRAGFEGAWKTVAAGDRLDAVQATALLESNDILALGAMADFARARAVGDEASTGKRPGADVRDGTVTLPLIFALEVRPELAPLLSREGQAADVATVLQTVAASGALARARGVALGYIEEARRVLETCPDTVERELLAQVAAQVVDRYS